MSRWLDASIFSSRHSQGGWFELAATRSFLPQFAFSSHNTARFDELHYADDKESYDYEDKVSYPEQLQDAKNVISVH